jgi:hypothetical protein
MEKRMQALKALTVADELKEHSVATTLRLRYRGKQYYDVEHTKYERLWDVLTPIDGYSQSGYPTFTLTGLIEKGLI